MIFHVLCLPVGRPLLLNHEQCFALKPPLAQPPSPRETYQSKENLDHDEHRGWVLLIDPLALRGVNKQAQAKQEWNPSDPYQHRA